MVWDVYAVAFYVDEAPLRAEVERYFSHEGRSLAALLDKALARALLADPAYTRALLSSDLDSLVEMVFVRDVSRSAIRKAMAESLLKALGEGERKRVDAFVSQLDRDLKKGDRLRMRARPGGDIVVSLETAQRTLHDEVIARALWVPYLGADSVTPALRRSVADGVAAIQHCPDCRTTPSATASTGDAPSPAP